MKKIIIVSVAGLVLTACGDKDKFDPCRPGAGLSPSADVVTLKVDSKNTAAVELEMSYKQSYFTTPIDPKTSVFTVNDGQSCSTTQTESVVDAQGLERTALTFDCSQAGEVKKFNFELLDQLQDGVDVNVTLIGTAATKSFLLNQACGRPIFNYDRKS